MKQTKKEKRIIKLMELKQLTKEQAETWYKKEQSLVRDLNSVNANSFKPY